MPRPTTSSPHAVAQPCASSHDACASARLSQADLPKPTLGDADPVISEGGASFTRAHSLGSKQRTSAASMQETRGHPTVQPEATDALTAAALRVEAWSGESFLHPGEDAAEVLAEGRARRRALDAALAEMDAGRRSPSTEWKVEYALMLGLERVLTDKPSRLASGTELRRHQIDALAGMLAELIARHEEHADNGNGNGNGGGEPGRGRRGARGRRRERSRRERRGRRGRGGRGVRPPQRPRRGPPLPLPPSDRVRQDDRGSRLRRSGPDDGRPHPHAPAPAGRPVHA